jgi:hypothetical protein
MPENKPFKPGTGYKRPTLSKSEMSTVKKEVSKAKPVAAKKPVAKKPSTSSFADRAVAVEKSNKAKGVTNIATNAPSTGVPSSVRNMQRMGRTAKELNIKPKEGMGIIEYMAPTGVGSSATSVLKGLTSEPVVSATKAALETPLPLGNAVTRATSGALTPSNIISTYVKASSIKSLADPNSDTRKSVKKAIKNPTLDNVVNAGINTGIDVAGAGIMPKSSKYVLKSAKYGAKARPLLTKAAVLGNDFLNKFNK